MNVNIKVDFQNVMGKMKPIHGIGQPPLMDLVDDSMMHYLKEAGIPYSRLHDMGGLLNNGLFVDIPYLFRDFDADENDPASYDFAYTDRVIEAIVKAGCEPYFRLGVTIENQHLMKAYHIFPPKDFGKWARVCEHVIRHYREGWANGYHFNITYWEIWNEPDDCMTPIWAAQWKGTPEAYFELYTVTAKHLKACFGDAIKVGGYAHCGLYEYASDMELKGCDRDDEEVGRRQIWFMHEFFKYQNKTGAPIDFFSWHVYSANHPTTRADFRVIANHAEYCRRILDHYGYKNAEHHLNEWNIWTMRGKHDWPNASARTLAFTLMMQNTSTDVMCYYTCMMGYTPYSSLINADSGTPYRAYYALAMFNTLYQLKNQVAVESSDGYVFVGAARDGKKAAIVISNTNDFDVEVSIDVNGFPTTEILTHRIDEHNRNTQTGEKFGDGTFTIPANGCLEIKLYDLT